MLHYETIESGTLELLKKFMAVPEFAGLRLVGGTSMALQVGHRRSVDLDLFGVLDLEPREIDELVRSLGNTVVLKSSRNIHIYMVDAIKVDIVNYSYPWLTPMCDTDNLHYQIC